MKSVRSGIIGFLSVLFSGAVVFGALSLGALEGTLTLPPTSTVRPTLPIPNLTPIGMVSSPTIVPFSPTPLPATQTVCPPPPGWVVYVVRSGDTLSNLASQRSVTLEQILQANCLATQLILPDTQIYLPPQPVSTQLIPTLSATFLNTATLRPVCGPPPGWIRYTVQVGDTLTRLSGLYRVTVWQLRTANCLVSDLIRAGSRLWVPNVATSTFTAGPPDQDDTPTPLPTVTQTHTIVPSLPATSTATATGTPTSTSTSTSTIIPIPTGTPTPTATSTIQPTSTSTPTDEPTPTETSTTP